MFETGSLSYSISGICRGHHRGEGNRIEDKESEVDVGFGNEAELLAPVL